MMLGPKSGVRRHILLGTVAIPLLIAAGFGLLFFGGSGPKPVWEDLSNVKGNFVSHPPGEVTDHLSEPLLQEDTEYILQSSCVPPSQVSYSVYSCKPPSGKWSLTGSAKNVPLKGEHTGFTIHNGEVLVLQVPIGKNGRAQGSWLLPWNEVVATSSGIPVRWPLYYAAGALTTEPDTKRTVVPRSHQQNQSQPVVVRFSLSDPAGSAKASPTPVDVEGYNLREIPNVLTPYGVFWVRPGADSQSQVVWKQSTYTEVAAQDTLMFTPFGGKPVIVKPNSLVVSLTYVGNVVRFAEAGIYPRMVSARYEVPADNSALPIKLLIPPLVTRARPMHSVAYTREIVSNGVSTLRVGERCYWLERNADENVRKSDSVAGVPGNGSDHWGLDANNTIPNVLMSARPDGSDVHVVGELRDEDGNVTNPRLVVDAEKLYLMFSHYKGLDTPEQADKVKVLTYLARLHPERSGELLGSRVLLTAKLAHDLNYVPIVKGHLYFRTSGTWSDFLGASDERVDQNALKSLWYVKLPE